MKIPLAPLWAALLLSPALAQSSLDGTYSMSGHYSASRPTEATIVLEEINQSFVRISRTGRFTSPALQSVPPFTWEGTGRRFDSRFYVLYSVAEESGLVGGLSGAGSVRNSFLATYELQGDTLSESIINVTRRAPQAFWSRLQTEGRRDAAAGDDALRGEILSAVIGDINPGAGEQALIYLEERLPDGHTRVVGLIDDWDNPVDMTAAHGHRGEQVSVSRAALAPADPALVDALNVDAGADQWYVLKGDLDETPRLLQNTWVERLQVLLGEFAAIADEHHFFLYGISQQSVSEARQQEEHAIANFCGDSAGGKITLTTISSTQFSHVVLGTILEGLRMAVLDGLDDEDQEEHFLQTVEQIRVVLEVLGPQATRITQVNGSGNCQGFWSNDHWVLETPYGTYTVSLGGGE